MGMFDNEITADNRMRELDELSTSPLSKPIARSGETVEALAGAISGGVLGKITGAFKFADLVRRLGVPTIEQNLDYLGNAIELAISRVERKLESQEDTIDNFRNQLNSKEFVDSIAAAVLQTQRTNSKKRLDRLASIVASSVEANDLDIDQTGDLMRAAVELNEFDLKVLQEIYDAQKGILFSYQRLDAQWAEQVAATWANRFGMFDSPNWVGSRGSLAKLQSFGFISQVTTNMTTTGEVRTQPYGLLPDGKRFFERIQELAAQ